MSADSQQSCKHWDSVFVWTITLIWSTIMRMLSGQPGEWLEGMCGWLLAAWCAALDTGGFGWGGKQNNNRLNHALLLSFSCTFKGSDFITSKIPIFKGWPTPENKFPDYISSPLWDLYFSSWTPAIAVGGRRLMISDWATETAHLSL